MALFFCEKIQENFVLLLNFAVIYNIIDMWAQCVVRSGEFLNDFNCVYESLYGRDDRG